jgi:hypothetical protein
MVIQLSPRDLLAKRLRMVQSRQSPMIKQKFKRDGCAKRQRLHQPIT